MAGAVEQAEDGIVIVAVIGAIALLIWWAGGINFFQGLASGEPGTLQSMKNAFSGFPSGADPGTSPLFQWLQGLAESARNFGGYIFGSNGSNYTPSQATAIENFQENYQVDPNTLQQAVQNGNSDLETWISQVQSNPATLPFF